MTHSPVDLTTFLGVLTPEQLHIVELLRGIVRKFAPAAEETILWRSLWYHRPALGGRIKGAICSITPKRGVVELGFVHGAMFRDPAQLLEGKGKAKRSATIHSLNNVPVAALSDLIQAASKYDPSGK